MNARAVAKRQVGCVANAQIGYYLKKGRFQHELADPQKRSASCMEPWGGGGGGEGGSMQQQQLLLQQSSSAAAAAAAADKRGRLGAEDYAIHEDVFVQAHVASQEKAVEDLQAQLGRVSQQFRTALAENQTLKAVVPVLNKKYCEETAKVVQLQQMVAKYAAELQRVRQQLADKESECRLLTLHMQRGTCTSANNASMFNPF